MNLSRRRSEPQRVVDPDLREAIGWAMAHLGDAALLAQRECRSRASHVKAIDFRTEPLN